MAEQFTPEIAGYLRALTYTQLIVGANVYVVLLVFQLAAFRRHRKWSFVLVSVSTLFGIGAFGLTAAISLLPPEPETWLYLSAGICVLFCVQGIIGLIGVFLLFREYDKLAATQPTTLQPHQSLP